MKRAIFLLMSVLAVIVSCERFDDSAIWEELKNHDERITRLEALCKEMNSNISALQTIVKAPSNKGYDQIGDAFFRALHRVIPAINKGN